MAGSDFQLIMPINQEEERRRGEGYSSEEKTAYPSIRSTSVPEVMVMDGTPYGCHSLRKA